MERCQVDGCGRAVSRAGHSFCLEHWKAERSGAVVRCAACGRWHEGGEAGCRACGGGGGEPDAGGGMWSSTRLGRHFGLSNVRVNLTLAELGWIEKYGRGWVPTELGNGLGANVREMGKGVPFVVWPEAILGNAALRASVAEQAGEGRAASQRTSGVAERAGDASAEFRARFPATLRTQDGHLVRSRAEVLIDNWLYMQGLVHAYERRLPIEEECYCDFYLPGGRGGGGRGVYVEFWGRESDPRYRERQAVKRGIYANYGMRLIELGDAEVERLDDVLPRELLRFGIESV